MVNWTIHPPSPKKRDYCSKKSWTRIPKFNHVFYCWNFGVPNQGIFFFFLGGGVGGSIVPKKQKRRKKNKSQQKNSPFKIFHVFRNPWLFEYCCQLVTFGMVYFAFSTAFKMVFRCPLSKKRKFVFPILYSIAPNVHGIKDFWFFKTVFFSGILFVYFVEILCFLYFTGYVVYYQDFFNVCDSLIILGSVVFLLFEVTESKCFFLSFFFLCFLSFLVCFLKDEAHSNSQRYKIWILLLNVCLYREVFFFNPQKMKIYILSSF